MIVHKDMDCLNFGITPVLVEEKAIKHPEEQDSSAVSHFEARNCSDRRLCRALYSNDVHIQPSFSDTRSTTLRTDLPDGGVVLGLEPLDGVLTADLVREADLGLAALAGTNAGALARPIGNPSARV